MSPLARATTELTCRCGAWPPPHKPTRAVHAPNRRPRKPNPFVRYALTALHAHGNPHAAADTERCEALLGVALLHLVQQGHQPTGTGSSDRVPKCDRAAVDIHLAGIPTKILVYAAGLACEGLMGLNQIE